MIPPIAYSPTLFDRAQNPCEWLAMFGKYAVTQPEGIAVKSGGRQQTFGELNSAAQKITTFLREHGIGPGDYVGMGINRSLELPSALLGIIGSGAAYIPLDPGYPAARIGSMISSAKLKWVLTTKANASIYPGVKTLLLEDAKNCDATAPSAGEIIYAIFTSGSTGEPKAAAVRHSGFSNLLDWYGKECGLSSTDRTLVISSPSFDLTQKNFFAPLATGGRLVLDENPTYDISRILEIIRSECITLINCTPSAFYPLVDAAAENNYQALISLRFAVLGGEPISVPRLRAWLEHPSCRAEVMNSYGPTECTDICAYHRLHRGSLDDFPFVPTGKEIPNVCVSIRDESMAELPIGSIGELCIEGAGVGDGYLNDDARTASRFINGVYRTGDLAKRHACGTLEFRGRADHQVKINGHRIELGEIEIALNQHDDIREAVVIASDSRLIAHVLGTATVDRIRAHLAARLPSYMIPAEFCFPENFPLTPNGKVDRLALAKPVGVAKMQHANDGSMESRILALWSEIMGRDVRDAQANFFDLGGSSIQLAIAHVRLVKMVGRDFPITELFARPNASSLARFLTTPEEAPKSSAIQDRARLAKAGFSQFRRPPTR